MADSEKDNERDPHARLVELVEENNRLRQQIHQLEGEIEEYRVQLAGSSVNGRMGGAGNALRWQVGDVVVQGLSRPGWATVRVPDRLIRLVWRAFRRRHAG